jgi:hypothetical protein
MQIARRRPRDAAGLPPSLEMFCFPMLQARSPREAESCRRHRSFGCMQSGIHISLQIGTRRVASCEDACQASCADSTLSIEEPRISASSGDNVCACPRWPCFSC